MLILALALGAFAFRVRVVESQRRDEQDRHEQELLAEKRQAAIEKAQLAAIGCQFAEAEEALREAERLGASTGEVRMLRGWIAYYSDRGAEAVQHFEQALNLLPQSLAARALLSVGYYKIAEFGKANRALREMDELTAQSAEDYLFRGYAWQVRAPAKGLTILDEAVQRRPSPLARVLRAEALGSLAEETGAVTESERAVQEAEVAKQLLPGNPTTTTDALEARLVCRSL